MAKINLSIVLATFNEEQNISRCLQAVKGWAEEIIVVDGSSTDQTREIARSLGVKVYKTTNKPIFHINKQIALEKANKEWILQLDADEVVTEKLKEEVYNTIHDRKKLYDRGSKDINGYYIPRKNYFLGRWLKKGGQYPDYVIRLVRKGKAHFPCKSVHEQIAVDGKIGCLNNPLDHYTTPTVSRYWLNANRYTSLTAYELYGKETKLNLVNFLHYLFIKPLVTFFSLYFRHKGFMDGVEGFLFALFSALHWPMAYFKYWELKSKKKLVNSKIEISNGN